MEFDPEKIEQGLIKKFTKKFRRLTKEQLWQKNEREATILAHARLKKLKKTKIERQTMKNRKKLMKMRDEFYEKNRERRNLLARQQELESTGDEKTLKIFKMHLKNLEEDLKRLVFWCDIDLKEMAQKAAENQKENEMMAI